jgi:GNAT superfamily N-acetyltransferase
VIDRISLGIQEVVEAFKEGGWRNLLGKRFYFNRALTPCEMDLGSLPELEKPVLEKPYQIIQFTEKLAENDSLIFPDKRRYLKTRVRMRKGLTCYVLLKDRTVVGDIWCDCPEGPDERASHDDLGWLRIENRPGEVYSFDMFIDAEERGNNLAGPFMKGFLYVLKDRGFKKSYGYYWSDYMPALWMHRILKFQEREQMKMWRFLFMRGGRSIGKANGDQ